MSNLREQIERELQTLSQELGQFQTNVQYLNQSKALANSAITSLNQINDLFQQLATEFQGALSGHRTKLKDTEEEFSLNVRSLISQLAIIVEDLNATKDQSLLPEKILQELSSISDTLNNLDKPIAALSDRQDEGFRLLTRESHTIQESIKNFKDASAEQSKSSEQKISDQFSQFSEKIQQLFWQSRNTLQSLETTVAQQHQKTTEEIDRLKDKLQILQEKNEMTTMLLKSQEEKNRTGRNTILIIASIILVIELVNLGIQLIP